MAFGVICSCCGEKVERENDADFDPAFACQPCSEEPTASLPDMTTHTIPSDTPCSVLEATKAFDGLTAKEQAYAFHLSKADWEGAKICLIQTSPEAAPIFSLLQLCFSAQPVAELVEVAKKAGVSSEECDAALQWGRDKAVEVAKAAFAKVPSSIPIPATKAEDALSSDDKKKL